MIHVVALFYVVFGLLCASYCYVDARNGGLRLSRIDLLWIFAAWSLILVIGMTARLIDSRWWKWLRSPIKRRALPPEQETR